MNRTMLAGAMIATLVVGVPALARDPETLQPSRGRGEGFVPERVDTSKLHGKPPEPRERRRLYERVEADVDRGRGRVEDEQTHEVRRLQDRRDERLGRIKPQRETERFEEEYDRRRRVDATVARERTERREADSSVPTSSSTIVREPLPPGPGGSALARVVAEQEQLLETARERYQADLRAAETERDEALRAAQTNPARSAAARRFTERRAELTRAYQAYRRGILGD